MSAEGGIPFGSYSLFRRLARGGMAEVFLARQRHLDGYDRRVAVKRILPHLSDSHDFVRMFLSEARLAARLSHPNIVHIYDFGKVGDEYFIAMEYVEGVHAGQLIKHTRTERLPWTLLARIGADAAAALHYAHNFADADGKPLGLVHRDVSPPNLMVSFDGVVKLVDFGIAKATAVEALTNPGTVKGKYAYMSPEQTVARTLDGRSDVFSLGLVLWEIIAGRHIIERGNPVEAMRAIRDGKLPSIETVVPSIPEKLAHALGLALETDREERASALELSQALEAYIKASPELATPLHLATWVRARFQPMTTGAVPSLPEAGPGTRVATSASSSASVATPGGGLADSTDRQAARTPPHQLDDDATVIEGGTVVGADSGIREPEERAETREVRPPRLGTRPPPTPRPEARGPRPDLDQEETVSLRPEDKPTALVPPAARETVHLPPDERPTQIIGDQRARAGIDEEPTVFVGDPALRGDPTRPDPTLPTAPPPGAVPPSGPVTIEGPTMPLSGAPPGPAVMPLGTMSHAPLPVAESTFDGRVDRIVAFITSPGRRAVVAAAAGGVFAAIVGIVCIGVRGDDRAAANVAVDAAPVLAAAADAAPVVTELRIVTRPAGALAQVGDRRGQTPITFPVGAGTVLVRVELAGHRPVDRSVELAAGEHGILDLTLEPIPEPVPEIPIKPPERDRDRDRGRDRTKDRGGGKKGFGFLTARTRPWADVYRGVKKLGQTPFAEVPLPPGSHTLVFKHPGRRDVKKTITIESGKTEKLDFSLP